MGLSLFSNLTWYDTILLLALIHWPVSLPACLLVLVVGYAWRSHWAGGSAMLLGGTATMVLAFTAVDTGF
jgi:hypothetical protein